MSKFSIDKNYTATFNAATKEAARKTPFTLISFNSIEANENNFYSIEDIESLKYSIKTTGLQEPLIVLPQNNAGKYILISGERRWTAIKQLVEEGDERFGEIYCKILNPEDLQIPLSYDDKIKYLIVTANSHRNNTNEDILNEMKTLREIYLKLKENGEEVSSNLRPFVAEALGMSETQVQRYSSIEKHLIFEFFDLFCKDILPISVADNISKLGPSVQKEFYEQVRSEDKITQPTLDAFIAGKKKSKKAPASAVFPDKKTVSATKKAMKAASSCLSSPLAFVDEKKKAKAEKLLKHITDELNDFTDEIKKIK